MSACGEFRYVGSLAVPDGASTCLDGLFRPNETQQKRDFIRNRFPDKGGWRKIRGQTGQILVILQVI